MSEVENREAVSSPGADGTGRALLDRLGRFEAADARAAAMLGVPETQLLGHCLWDRFPTLRGTDLQHRCAVVLAGEGAQHFLFHHAVLDRWYVVVAEPVGPAQRPAAVEVRLTDVTEGPGGIGTRIRAERLDAAALALGSMSHDVNNCLTVILGNAEHLDEIAKEHADIANAARLIVSAGDRAAALTGRVLGFARRYARTGTEVDANGVMERLVATLPDAARRRVTIHPGCDAPSVVSDARNLESALRELLDNALKATSEGGSVELVAETAADGEHVRITVADTGTGMEPALLRHCVEPFRTTRPDRCGAGLGLSVAYAFATASGGALHLESRPGEGTRAMLELPGAPDAPSGGVSGAASAPHPGHVLLVEDDPTGRASISRQLRSLGYAVTEAGSSAEALGILRDGLTPTVLLTDVILPGGQDGASLVGDARRLRPALPAILMSGYAAGGAGNTARDGGTPMLPKPFRKAELAAILQSAISSIARTEPGTM